MLTIADRMKEFYENRSKTYLTRRVPVIIRIDGCHFHSFTKHLNKPFDDVFIKAMQLTTLDLCKHIQGCKFGYVESDEISLLLTDYDTLQTDAWFNYSVQKLCSVAASMATMYFNKNFTSCADELLTSTSNLDYLQVLNDCINLGAYFDARCFNIPKEEVINYFIWRQNDAARNSIQCLAQSLFSHKQIQGLNNSQLQEKLFQEKGINWNDLPTTHKRGSAVLKNKLNDNIPIFSQNKQYFEGAF